MRNLSKSKVINKLANKLIDEDGWILREKKGRTHSAITHPTFNYSYPIPLTPSCYHAEKNWIAGIKRIQRGQRA